MRFLVKASDPEVQKAVSRPARLCSVGHAEVSIPKTTLVCDFCNTTEVAWVLGEKVRKDIYFTHALCERCASRLKFKRYDSLDMVG